MKFSKLVSSLLIALSISSVTLCAQAAVPTGLEVIALAQKSLNGFSGALLASKVAALKSNGTPSAAIAAAMFNLSIPYADAKQALINGAGMSDAVAQSELVAAGYTVPTDSASGPGAGGAGGVSFGSIASTGGGAGGGGGTVSATR